VDNSHDASTRILRAVVLGAGSQGAVHASALAGCAGVEIVAVADPSEQAARELAARHGAVARRDAAESLDADRPDIVSICTPPAVHADLTRRAIASGARAVHVEKPIALTYGDALDMRDRARAAGAQLTVNHQRRLDPLHRAVAAEVADGAIGDVITASGYCANLFDWGSHTVDLLRLHLGDPAAEWVLAQIDVAARKRVYGALTETSSVVRIRFAGDREAVVVTGRDDGPLHPRGSAGIVVNGTGGRIEVFGRIARVLADGRPVREIVGDDGGAPSIGGADPEIVHATALAVADLVDALRRSRPAVLDIENGLRAAEIVFAAYESSVRRGRVDLPLGIRDNPLQRGLDDGIWTPVDEIVATY